MPSFTVTPDRLAPVAGQPVDHLMQALAGPLAWHLSQVGILDDRLQLVHILARGSHETSRFITLVEYGS
jgi:hypothetical protein